MNTRSKMGASMKKMAPNELENQLLALQYDVFQPHFGSIFEIDHEKGLYGCNLCFKRRDFMNEENMRRHVSSRQHCLYAQFNNTLIQNMDMKKQMEDLRLFYQTKIQDS